MIAVTDGSGTATSVNTYDEYGVPSSSNAGRFQYTGQMWIAEAGLYHYKARAYAPGLGRFLQSDRILYAGGPNIYGYALNDPINHTDPSGEIVPAMLAGCAIGALGTLLTESLDPEDGINVEAVMFGCIGGALFPVGGALGKFVATRALGLAAGSTSALTVEGVFGLGAAYPVFAAAASSDRDLVFGSLTQTQWEWGIISWTGTTTVYTDADGNEVTDITVDRDDIIWGWEARNQILEAAMGLRGYGLNPNGFGAAVMQQFLMTEGQSAVARIENMPYEVRATARR